MPYSELHDIAAEFSLSREAIDRLEALMDRVLASDQQTDLPGRSPETLHWSQLSVDHNLSTPGHAVFENLAAASGGALRPRYRQLKLLGRGGMGNVWRVRDRDLGRTVAMKILRAELLGNAAGAARFVGEAQVSAELQHPGIVPVHELGRMPDGRLYFTMREVRGRTLGAVIREVHQSLSSPQDAAGGWTFPRLIAAFHKVCETIAYAHTRGVVHRDLKPQNIMLGTHGATQVVDWGLAKLLRGGNSQSIVELPTGELPPDATTWTRQGSVAGTPAYMPPEQARGETDLLDTRSDVYAMGAILYEILSGRAPYAEPSEASVLERVLTGPPQRLTPSAHAPAELIAICEQAMARDVADRFPTASAMAGEVVAWLDGVRKREQARSVVRQAEESETAARDLRDRAGELRGQARAALAEVGRWEPQERKAPAWALEDGAAELERQARHKELEGELLLEGALTHDPDLPEAHAALAERYRAVHAIVEAARNMVGASRLETLLRTHAEALPDGHRQREELFTYLQGDGQLSLDTSPTGAEVIIERYALQHRRLVPVEARDLGRAPLRDVSLPMGSYRLHLRAAGRPRVCYPVNIGRLQRWDGVPPGGDTSQPIPQPIPLPSTLAPDEVLVPGGWFSSGGDRAASNALPARAIWLPSFVITRRPVSHREYIRFLNDLLAQGREDEALRWVPLGDDGASIYRRQRGRFGWGHAAGQGHTAGQRWQSDWPVTRVSWHAAQALAAWRAERTGHPWRLPGELEWEKAARGVDGRAYPWGDRFDPSWCAVRESFQGEPGPTSMARFPTDESPYGVLGMAGGVSEWTATTFADHGPEVTNGSVQPGAEDGEQAVTRGAGWTQTGLSARVCSRGSRAKTGRLLDLGFRVCRSFRGTDR